MKKIILALTFVTAFAMSAFQSNAQTGPMKATIPSSAEGAVTGADSVRVNGATAGYLYIKPLGDYKCASFQANVSRKTAAMNGSVTLQGSNDGLNYFATAAGDTCHVDNGATDVDKIDIAPATGLKYQYYRLKGVNTATTDTFTLRAFFTGRK